MKKLYASVLLIISASTNAAAPQATIQVEPFASDRPAQKLEHTEVIQNPDGTTTVNTVLIYEDGTKEKCTFVSKANPAPGNKPMLITISRACKPAAEREDQ